MCLFTLRWMDGSQVVFQRWDENQPEFKNFDENCAVMTHHNGECTEIIGIAITRRAHREFLEHLYNHVF